MGLDSSPNALRSRMFRKPNSSQGQRSEFPFLKRCHGGEHLRYQRRHCRNWVEAISGKFLQRN